uniref:Uncharacterized protein n=1 Tax=Lactuca sativa TaxID=4236 RepID=A0A9R1UTE2_LACSA|nr:hypothetical protein LSAT_V11C800393310 [Lactuca sativa]
MVLNHGALSDVGFPNIKYYSGLVIILLKMLPTLSSLYHNNVIARFNEIVTRPLMDGALDTFNSERKVSTHYNVVANIAASVVLSDGLNSVDRFASTTRN